MSMRPPSKNNNEDSEYCSTEAAEEINEYQGHADEVVDVGVRGRGGVERHQDGAGQERNAKRLDHATVNPQAARYHPGK